MQHHTAVTQAPTDNPDVVAAATPDLIKPGRRAVLRPGAAVVVQDPGQGSFFSEETALNSSGVLLPRNVEFLVGLCTKDLETVAVECTQAEASAFRGTGEARQAFLRNNQERGYG